MSSSTSCRLGDCFPPSDSEPHPVTIPANTWLQLIGERVNKDIDILPIDHYENDFTLLKAGRDHPNPKADLSFV